MSDKSSDPAVVEMEGKAASDGVQTVFDRFESQLPQCDFGLLGVCCRNCMAGPCRIDLFGDGPDVGTCGAEADVIVARNLLRGVAGGTAAHADHARHTALTLERVAEGEAPYEIRGVDKLESLASRLGVDADSGEVARVALECFGRQEGVLPWLEATAPVERRDVWEGLGVLPVNPDRDITEAMHRTTLGVDADPTNLLLGAVKLALDDGYAGLHMATDLQDVLFGVPRPVFSEASLGVLQEEMVNVAVHGHVPLLSEKIVEAAEDLKEEAIEAGAEGVNIVGVCCTGNEVLMRRGVPVATNYLGQEMAVVTGALDAVVVDVQCIMPGLAGVADCYHTRLITTMPFARIPGAEHVEFTEERADEASREIIRKAIEAYKERDGGRVSIPGDRVEMMAGFSVEAILDALGNVNEEDPLKPLIDNIAEGNIKGAVAMVGCNNPRVKHDDNHVRIARRLIGEDVLVVSTGCSAQALAKAGLLRPEAAGEAGDGLRGVLEAVGGAVGLDSLPPVLHMGSCVDNSRVEVLVSALAEELGVAIKDLPIAATAPEAMTEKALAIGTWAVALGVYTHVGVVPPVLGGEMVTRVLTEDVEDLLGGKFVVERDPDEAADLLLKHIMGRREALGI